jgi:hypothetical protein
MSGGKITEMNSVGYTSKITFVKQGIQTYTKTGGTFENNIDFEIGAGTTLDVGNSIVDGSLGQFSVGSSSTIRTSNSNGISSSGASGSIQTTNRYYSFAANYHYNRPGAQVTGSGIPSPLNGKLVIGSTSSATNLTLTNGSISINGTLILCSSSLANSTISSGTVTYGSSGILEYQGLSLQTSTIKEWPTTGPPPNITINNGTGVSLDNGRIISGTLSLTTGSLSIMSHTLTLNGTLVKTSGSLTGGSSSGIIIGGSSPTALDLPDVTLNNLLLDRTSGVRLTGNITIYGTMTMTNGPVALVSGKAMIYISGSRLKYNGTSNQTTGAEEFPLSNGPPSLEVDKSGGTSLNLNFSRTLNENLYLRSGFLAIGGNTLTLNGLITTTSGMLTGGPSSNIIFNGSGIGTTLPSVTLNNLTINRIQGILLGGDVTIEGTLSLAQGTLHIEARTLTINGYVSQSGGYLSGTLSSTLILGPAPSSTELPPVYVGNLQINRSAGIQMTGDVEVSDNLTLTAGSLSIGSNTLTLSGDLTLSGGNIGGGSNSGLVIGGASSPTITLPGLTLGSLTISRLAGVIFSNDVLLETSLILKSGTCRISGRLLTLNGSIQYNGGDLEGGPTSSLTVSGSGSMLTLNPVTLQTLNLNRMNGLSLNGDSEILTLFCLMNGNLNRHGFSLYGPASTLRYQGTIPQTSSDEEFPETDGPFNVQVMNPGGVNLHADRIIQGNLQLDAGSFFLGSHTFSLNGTIIRITGTLQGGGTGNLVFAPGLAPALLSAVDLNNLTIDRAAGVTMKGNCTIRGTLILTDGNFMVGSNQTLDMRGFPITGNPSNLKTINLSRLVFAGTQPGVFIPSGVVQLGFLTISNPSGVSLEGDLYVEGGTSVIQRFALNEHVLSGPGFFSTLPFSSLVIGHPDGVAGNIQVSGPMMLESDADYEFNGQTDQLTNFLPTVIPNTIRNLTISNADTKNVTLNSDLTLTGHMDILSEAKFTVETTHVLTVENDLVVY